MTDGDKYKKIAVQDKSRLRLGWVVGTFVRINPLNPQWPNGYKMGAAPIYSIFVSGHTEKILVITCFISKKLLSVTGSSHRHCLLSRFQFGMELLLGCKRRVSKVSTTALMVAVSRPSSSHPRTAEQKKKSTHTAYRHATATRRPRSQTKDAFPQKNT